MSPGRLGAKLICPGPPCAVNVLTKKDSPPRTFRMADFNSRIIPLMNHAQRIQDADDKAALVAELCPKAERALRVTTTRVQDVLPDCVR